MIAPEVVAVNRLFPNGDQFGILITRLIFFSQIYHSYVGGTIGVPSLKSF